MLDWLRSRFSPQFDPVRDVHPSRHLELCSFIWRQIQTRIDLTKLIEDGTAVQSLNTAVENAHSAIKNGNAINADAVRQMKMDAMMLSGAAHSEGKDGISLLFQLPLLFARALDQEYDATSALREVISNGDDAFSLLHDQTNWHAVIKSCQQYRTN